jgi:membrane protein implicated in regulation of membrane protease activity
MSQKIPTSLYPPAPRTNQKVDKRMQHLIFDPEIWLALGLLCVIVEMLLDGSMAFFLPLGIGCAFTGAGLAGCAGVFDGACSIYTRWYYLIAMTAIGATIAALLLRRAFHNSNEPNDDVNKF